jgi:hypothetical protein
LAGALWLLFAGARAKSPAPAASGPHQATGTPATIEPTDVPPSPEPPTPGPTAPRTRCTPGLPVPRLFWTIHAFPVGPESSIWVPFQRNGGPLLRAWVRARYDDVWYTALIDERGRIEPYGNPRWPRSDIIQLAAAGTQPSRTGQPACGRSSAPVPPPCYADAVFPLVFLDKLGPDGPYLRRLYFWVPPNQVYPDDTGHPARLSGKRLADCDTAQVPGRLPNGGPIYLQFDGCGSPALRVDSCYEVGGNS